MGLFSERKPYTAISAETEALLQQGDSADPAKLVNLVELIQGSRPADAGAHEAGRILRKRLKHGSPHDQEKALNLLETLVDNGIRGGGLVTDTGLGEQLCMIATSHAGHIHGGVDLSKSSKVAKHAQSLLSDWSRRKDPNLSRWFKQAGLPDRTQRSKRQSMHPDDDLDAAVFRDEEEVRSAHRTGGRKASDRRSMPAPPSPSVNESHRRSRSHTDSRARSRSPSPINLRGAGLTTTIATAHNVSTRLTNALITNRPGSYETAEYYRQTKQLRRRIIQLVHDQSPEVQSYIGQLLSANEELIEALQAHDAVADGRNLAAQDDHEELDLPARTPVSAVRPPPSPTLAGTVSSDEDDLPSASSLPSKRESVVDLDDPFADHNEESETPKHTPFW